MTWFDGEVTLIPRPRNRRVPQSCRVIRSRKEHDVQGVSLSMSKDEFLALSFRACSSLPINFKVVFYLLQLVLGR